MNQLIESFYKEFNPGLKGDGRLQHSAAFSEHHQLYDGKETHCRDSIALLAKLWEPTRALEIGCWKFDTSKRIAETCPVDAYDIKIGGYSGADIEPPDNVHAKYLMPYHSSYDKWKYDPGIVYPGFKDLTNKEIAEFNIKLLKQAAPKKGYDFIFIDGDHSYEGVKLDFEQVQHVSHERTLFCFDNIRDERFGVWDFFQELKGWKHDFQGWNEKNPDKIVDCGIYCA